MTESESHFVQHLPCTACGSSDANALYSDGHTVCHKCGSYQHAAGKVPSNQRRPRPRMLIDSTSTELPKRRLTETTCAKFGYGRATFKDRPVQVAPYFDKDGVMVAQKIRFPDKDFTILGDMKQAGLFGQHLWKPGKKLVVTEGEIDAMTVSQLMGNKWPVVSVPNGAQGAAKALQKHSDWVQLFDEVILMLDNDEEGEKAAVECAKVLTPGKAKIARLPLKDASEMLQAGRGEEVLTAFWNAAPYRPDGIVTGKDIREHIFRQRKVRSTRFPHTGLNEKTLGMRPGEVITFCAGTGAGKTTFVRETAFGILPQLGEHEKVGYIGLEESVGRAALGFCSLLAGRPLHLEQQDTELDRDAIGALCAQFEDRVVFHDHWGSVEAEHLIGQIRFMVQAEGCTHIVLDHLSIMCSGIDTDDERKALDVAMTKLATLAQEVNCCILLICHLRKADGKPHEEGRAISMSDLRGTNGIAQLSHTIVSIERDQQGDDKLVCAVRVLKCRWTGNTGLAGHMKYDPATGRLLEHCVEFDESTEAAGTADY